MPPKKRAYVPKTKGCHECSQRRIHCDRTEPECGKCRSRGLTCSGLGIRHRFNDGVAARGKWVGKTMERIYQEKDSEALAVKNYQTISGQTLSRGAGGDESSTAEPDKTSQDQGIEDEQGVEEAELSCTLDIERLSRDLTLDDHTIFFSLFLQTVPDSTPAWQKYLFLHFSKTISSEMVAIDGVHNVWRHLLLPLAQTDNLIMDAVLTASAFHFYLNHLPNQFKQRRENPGIFNPPIPHPDRLYARVINGLRKRQELLYGDDSTKHSVLISIILLLTSTMVIGGPDFSVLFNMLESAVDAMGGQDSLGDGVVGGFIMRELQKLRMYTAPHLGEERGLEFMSSPARIAGLFAPLNHCIQQYPEHASVFSQVADLVHQAQSIYLRQFMSDEAAALSIPDPTLSMPNSNHQVQHFIDTLQALPPSSPIEHMLVWTTFVAASDCQLDEHKVFFEGVFRKHYARSGFANLLRGIETLHKIWARKPGERWTSLLPTVKVVVM